MFHYSTSSMSIFCVPYEGSCVSLKWLVRSLWSKRILCNDRADQNESVIIHCLLVGVNIRVKLILDNGNGQVEHKSRQDERILHRLLSKVKI